MLFSSLTFLSVFLPATLLVYYVLPRGCRNYVLLLASIVFYAWGEPKYLPLLLGMTVLNWLLALLIGKFRRQGLAILALALLANFGWLAYFKYGNFLVQNLNLLFKGQLGGVKALLPLGISFYTFSAVSYLADVYKGGRKALASPLDVAFFITLFPKLLSGPIVKYHDFEGQMEGREHSFGLFAHGLKRFICGLAKKMLLANTLGAVADQIFALPGEGLSCSLAWLGAVTYSLQLYFDFSGYADMAIGTGELFGFRIMENFDYPYVTQSITEFWRRWHISLSTWFRDYLYIPLGGNRQGSARTYLNLLIVFLATGLWHGAAWTFIAWGLWHGFFIVLERVTGLHKREGGLGLVIFRHAYALLAVVFGWVLFRADDFGYALRFMGTMLGIRSGSEVLFTLEYYMRNSEWLALLVAVLLSMPLCAGLLERCRRGWQLCLLNGWLLVLFVLSFMAMASSTYAPFLYFKF